MSQARIRLDRLATMISFVAVSAVVLVACGGSGRSTSATSAVGSSVTRSTSAGPATGASQRTAASSETAPGIVRASSGAIVASMHASTHHPRVNQHWPISFAVTRAREPTKAEVAYEYMFAGAVVAHRSHYAFTGHFHDVFTWPSSAVGYPLTFRAVITADGVTFNLDYPVQVVN